MSEFARELIDNIRIGNALQQSTRREAETAVAKAANDGSVLSGVRIHTIWKFVEMVDMRRLLLDARVDREIQTASSERETINE